MRGCLFYREEQVVESAAISAAVARPARIAFPEREGRINVVIFDPMLTTAVRTFWFKF